MKTKYDLGGDVWFFLKNTNKITHAIVDEIHAYFEHRYFADNGKLVASSSVLVYKVLGLELSEGELFHTREECAKHYAEYYRKLFEKELC